MRAALLWGGLLAALGSAPATAQTTVNRAGVGGIEFLHLRTASAGLSPEQRALKVQERVNHALSIGPIHPLDITTGPLNGDWCVLLRGQRFFTVDAETARINHTPAQTLAGQWAARMRSILPALTRPTGRK